MPPPPCEHPLTQTTSERDRRPKIDLKNPIKLLKREVGQLPNPWHPSIGDKDVDVTASVDNPLNLIPPTEVGNDGPPPNLLSKVVKDVAPPPREGEHTPFTVQPPGDGLPQPTRSPGKKHRPPTKFHVRMVVRPSEAEPQRTLTRAETSHE